MLTVHKYALPVADQFILDIPKGAELLHVDVQHGEPHLWAKVDTSKRLEPRSFLLAGTGHPLPEIPSRFVGTVLLHGGVVVFHLFEVII